jgi:hypothetical protein
LADFIIEKVVSWESSPFEQDIPIVIGNFIRSGDIRSNPKWRIETDAHVVETEWTGLEPEVVIDSPLKSGGFTIINSVLFFSTTATMKVAGQSAVIRSYEKVGVELLDDQGVHVVSHWPRR